MTAARLFPRAAVASPHYLATTAGVHVLMQGGNAVDAAIATNLVLAVVCPHLCGVGGDLFALIFAEGRIHGLNSSGCLPKAATLPPDGQVPVRGVGAATVPGAVAGWLAMHDRFGSMPIGNLAAPAIRYAQQGFPRTSSLRRSITRSLDVFDDGTDFARLFLRDEPTGRNVDLAATLGDLSNFYSGPVAQNAPAPFTPDDFSSHQAQWVDPVTTPFRGHDIYEMPPNSRGHLVLRALDRLEPLEGSGPDDAQFHERLFRAIASVSLTGDTVYLCVHDEKGMAVSLNESNFMGFGSGVLVPGTGVHLHNRGAYLTPATYKGGVRPIHTLSPGMSLLDGQPSLIFGTMGGEAQIQIHMQLLARVLVAGQELGAAVAAPRWVKHGEGQLLAEEGLPEMGATVIPRSDIAGHAHMIRRTDEGIEAVSDPRSDGLALGY
ncbi:MAG TPA: gamma-glutamyltransferase [Actinomycetota bacterium]|nr:gamma-glutamyltransferase [Actinomycetota bacterium]